MKLFEKKKQKIEDKKFRLTFSFETDLNLSDILLYEDGFFEDESIEEALKDLKIKLGEDEETSINLLNNIDANKINLKNLFKLIEESFDGPVDYFNSMTFTRFK